MPWNIKQLNWHKPKAFLENTISQKSVGTKAIIISKVNLKFISHKRTVTKGSVSIDINNNKFDQLIQERMHFYLWATDFSWIQNAQIKNNRRYCKTISKIRKRDDHNIGKPEIKLVDNSEINCTLLNLKMSTDRIIAYFKQIA